MKIQYHPLTILFLTAVLTGLTIMFLYIISTLGPVTFSSTPIIFLGLLLILILLNWLDLFFIPFIKGRPALILNSDGLYVTSIGQLILWKDIQTTQIKYTKNNHIVKIFVKEPTQTAITTNSLTKYFWCRLSKMLFDTPFSFSTIFIKGRAVDIYDCIKSRIK
jgi:hypothetical protein